METLRIRHQLLWKNKCYLKGNSVQSKIRDIESNFDLKIANSLRRHTDPMTAKKRRLEFIDNNFEKAVQENTYAQLQAIDRKKKIVDELTPSIYGAIGEQKVSKELENLSDELSL